MLVYNTVLTMFILLYFLYLVYSSVYCSVLLLLQLLGRAMAQAVSRWPLRVEARVRARVSPCGICDGQIFTGTGFSLCSSVFPCQHNSTIAPYSSITAP
jgi:hypothetical protein